MEINKIEEVIDDNKIEQAWLVEKHTKRPIW